MSRLSLDNPEPLRCHVCGGKPFHDHLTRDTVAQLMEGRCNEPSVWEISCCGLSVKSWCYPEARAIWDAQQAPHQLTSTPPD